MSNLDSKRTHGSFTGSSTNQEKPEKSKEKTKQLSNVSMAKVEKKEERKENVDVKKHINTIEKESLMTNISSNYGSNKNEDLPSPSNINNKVEIKFPTSTNNEPNSQTNNDHSLNTDKINSNTINNENQVKKTNEIKEEVIDPQVLFDRRNKCLQFIIDLFLNKNEFPMFLGVNKTLASSAVTHLRQIFKTEYNSIEEKIKHIKEVL